MRHDRGLLACGGGGLGIGGVADIAERIDVGQRFVPQRRLIDIDPARGIGQRRDADEVGGHLRGHDVDHVETGFNGFSCPIGLGLGEPGSLGRAIHAGQAMLEMQLRLVFLDVLHQRRDIFLDPEQHRTGVEEIDLDVLQPPGPVPVIGRQIEGLLRSPGAFDRHRRLGEDGAPAFQPFDQFPGIGREVIAVVRGDTVAAQRLGQPLDPRPVQLQPRRDDQLAVFDHPAAIKDHHVLVRLKGCDSSLDPAHASGDQ